MSIVQSLTALGDPARSVTMTELRVLSDLDDGSAPAFVTAWRTLAEERRREIVGRLIELAEDNIDLHFAMVLRLCLDDEDPAVRTRAAEGLWEDESTATLRRLLVMLANDPATEPRAAAAVTLGRFAYMAELGELGERDEQRLRAALLGALDDQSQPVMVRRRALESAGYFGALPQVGQAIEQAYAKGDQALRESALVAMGRSMQPRWMATIGAGLASAEAPIRFQAARAAGEFAEDGEGFLAQLLPLLDDDDGEVSLAAIWAMGQIGGPQARRALEQIGKQGDEAQRQAAEAALGEMLLDDDPLGV